MRLWLCVDRASAVYGSATMNATLALGVFLFNMWRRGVYWAFNAEVIPMVVLVAAVGLNGTFRDTMRTLDALLLFALYPLSLIAVAVLKACGLDPDLPPYNTSSSSNSSDVLVGC